MSEYQTITPGDKRALSDFLVRNGQFLLPMVRLIEEARTAIDDVIDVTGRACVEAVLEGSAAQLAGARSPGKRSGDLLYHGHQDGVVHLKERKLRVRKPRLRHKIEGEIEVPAYAALRTRPRMARRMMQILIDGLEHPALPERDPRDGPNGRREQERRQPGQHRGR